MVYIELERTGFKYLAKATVQIESISDINYEHLIRGIHSSKNALLLTTQLGKINKFFISTFSRSSRKNDSIQLAASKMRPIQALLVGSKLMDNGIDNIEIKPHTAMCHVIGIPTIGFHDQGYELISKFNSAGINGTSFLNIQPIALTEDILRALHKHEFRDKYLENDTGFFTSYSFFLSEDHPETLRMNIETSMAILGSVYDSEHSNLQVKIETKQKKNIKTLKKLLMGKLHYASLISTRELVPLMQIPHVTGIDYVSKPEFYVPRFSEYQVNNGIEIGTVLDNFDEEVYPAYLDPNTIFQNIAVWGVLGFGKSTFIKHLVTRLHNKTQTRSLIFDLHNEYREIISQLNGNLGKDILVFNPFIHGFSINPLEIPADLTGKERDIVIVETVENFISLLRHGLDWVMGEVQLNRCRTHLYDLYEQRSCPTIGQLIEKLEGDMRTRTKKDEDNLPFKLSQFTVGFYGELFNQPHTSLPFDLIENCTTIFELEKLPLELSTFFITVFLTQFWNIRRLNKNNPGILIVADEFHHLDKMVIPRKIISEGRKYRTGFLASHQGPNQLKDETLLGEEVRNTVTKVIFRSTNRYDNDLILASLGLNKKNWMEYFTRMDIGEAIVTTYGISQPFRIKTQIYTSEKTISDDQVKELGEFLIKKADINETRPIQVQTQKETLMSPDEERFIQLLYENPGSRAKEIIPRLRIMVQKGWEIKTNLVEKGLIVEKEVKTGPGRPKKILELTNEGCQILGVKNNGTPAHFGGNEHRMMIQEFAGLLTRIGYKVKIEDSCDIKATNDDEILAFEVETCKNFNNEQITYNIDRNLKWASDIVITCPNSKNKGRIMQLINNRNIKKAHVLTYNELRKVLMDSNNETV
jgi:hypothetical protein